MLFQRCGYVLRNHWWVIVLAFIVGIISVAPNLLAIRSLGSAYRGIPLMYADDEDIYLARMQEIVDGYWRIGSPFFAEYKQAPALMPPIGESVYVLIHWIMRLPLTDVLVFTKFLFPLVLFVLIFALIALLIGDGGSKLTAAAGAMIITLASDVASFHEILRFLRGYPIHPYFSIWTRPVNPITGALLLLTFFLLVWSLIQRKRIWSAIVAGVVLAISVSYFFSFGMGLSVAVFLCGFYALRREWRIVKLLCLSLAVCILASAPILFPLVSSTSGIDGKYVAERNGMFFTHVPLLNKRILVALALFFAYSVYRVWKKESMMKMIKEDWWVYSAALLLGALWAFSQQILTGRTIWPYHFVQYSAPIVVIVLLVVGARFIRPQFRRLWDIGMIVLIACSLGNGIVMAASYRFALQGLPEDQQNAGIFTWLNTNAPKDSVVFVLTSREKLVRQFPAYTWCNNYWMPWVIYGVPQDRILHNFFVLLHVYGVTPERAEEYLKKNHSMIRAYFYTDWHQMFKSTSDAWSDQQAAELAKGYAEFSSHPFAEELQKYELDYVVSEGLMDPRVQKDFPPLERIGSFGALSLYRVRGDEKP